MEGNGMKELKAWLDRNKETFKNYSIDDVIKLATACGFDRQSVAQWAVSRKFKEAI